MDWKRNLTILLSKIPPSKRQKLKGLYEKWPTFGRKLYYAQRGEDAFLQGYFLQQGALTLPAVQFLPEYWRTEVSNGFYVDVGAHAPIWNSLTYWFYRQGWQGINIDAAPGTKHRFDKVRPRDTNLEALISDQDKEMVFYYWKTPFPSNTTSAEFAAIIADRYQIKPSKLVIRSTRLDTILERYLPADAEISFLTVDAEGHDLNVLRSNNWTLYRPKLLLVEDSSLVHGKLEHSEISRFMNSIGYKIYGWLRPTVVYRREDLLDWQDLKLSQLNNV